MYDVNKENNISMIRDRFECDLGFITHFVRNNGDELEANYGPYRLSSRFQPIFSVSHQDIIGYEGLVRAYSRVGNDFTPVQLFERKRGDFDEIFLDRLSRYLHSHNFSRQENRQDWLFLNVSPKVIVSGKQYGDYFQSLLLSAGIDPRRVVIEIVEQGIEDEAKLAEAAEYYRNMGCLIAIDDFGKGHSNFSRIWQLKPEIVKLDRELISQATASKSSRRTLKHLVSLIHESGSLVVMEGIETEYEALLALDSGADFVQGFYFAQPDKKLFSSGTELVFKHLCDMYRLNTEHDYVQNHESQRRYSQALKQSAKNLERGQSMNSACATLIQLPYVKRCYMLDEQGWLQAQISNRINDTEKNSSKFVPLSREKGMVWSQWREFLKARAQKGEQEVHLGAQHLSLDDGRLSRTLSINIEVQGKEYLLCCDVDVMDSDMELGMPMAKYAVAAS